MKKIILTMGTLLAAGSAFAGSYNPPATDNDNVMSAADSLTGYYASGQLGWTKQSVSGSASGRNYLGGQANVGYAYQINERFLVGPELGYGYYGAVDTGDQKVTATDLMAVVQFYANEQVNLLVKGGLAYTDSDSTDDSQKKTVGMSGLGVGYDVTQKVNLNMTYYHIFGKDDDANKVDSVFAGVTYRL